MGSRMEQFEQIRRDRDREGLSIRALAVRHGVHRRTVKQALASPVPPAKRAPVSRPAPKLGPYRALIDEWLVADRDAPPKQRHTAKRIWRRLVDEHGAEVAEVTVRQYVRARKREMGWPVGEVFVPQVHAPGRRGRGRLGRGAGRARRGVGEGASVRDARVVLRGGVLSGVAGRDPAGVPRAARRGVRVVRRRVRGDPVRQPDVGGEEGAEGPPAGRDRPVRRAALALPVRVAVHDAGLEGAHEKGGVEGEVGRFRRNHLVPVPELRDLAELNALLLAGCEQDLGRRIDGRAVTVREAWAAERPLLLALPAEPFDACETATPRVDAKSLVTIRQNRYSVPVALGGLRVSARIGAREITISHAGREVARHERLHGKFGTSAQLDHYLELLERKPGGLEHSVALAQERERGGWPDCFDELWAALTDRYGRSEAARQMVDVLLLCREHGARRRRARGPRRARRRRARRPRRRGSRPPRRAPGGQPPHR